MSRERDTARIKLRFRDAEVGAHEWRSRSLAEIHAVISAVKSGALPQEANRAGS